MGLSNIPREDYKITKAHVQQSMASTIYFSIHFFIFILIINYIPFSFTLFICLILYNSIVQNDKNIMYYGHLS